ncbi:zinc finger protein [Macleaya cordata]|uniref:Zinc finger protein n=1 Tax=Macleaya cordata TaxID=56857 RepID=A0A200RCV2_MACCD|nr:zinc finger protein [Macleaya cordata]
MADTLRGSKDHDEPEEVVPDYFRYYIREIQDLFSQNEDILSLSSQHSISSAGACAKDKVDNVDIHFSNVKEANALFSDGVSDGLSDFKRERLKASVKQSVDVLSQEVDEMLDPVLAMYRIKAHLWNKERLSTYPNSSHGVVSCSPCKKQKISSSPSSTTIPIRVGIVGPRSCGEGSVSEDMDDKCPDTVSSEESHFNDQKKSCSDCKSTKIPHWRDGPGGPKPSSNACRTKYKKRRATEDPVEVEEKNTEVDEDLLTLLENGGSLAKEVVKKYSDELSTKLEKMEQQLEELLDIVVSKCRYMNLAEKQQLRKLIQNLPPKNLDRVVEIVRRSKLPKGGTPCKEIHIDLEKVDNVTLWRLYYYVEAVASAKRLSSLQKEVFGVPQGTDGGFSPNLFTIKAGNGLDNSPRQEQKKDVTAPKLYSIGERTIFTRGMFGC